MDLCSLPNEIVQYIFGFLDHQSRLAVLQVCRQWKELASAAQVMDRIWLRLSFEKTVFMDQLTTLKDNFQKYRHVVIDCHDSDSVHIVSLRTHHLVNLAKVFTADNNVETLILFGMLDVTATDLLTLLQNVPKLKRLYLLGADFLQRSNMEQACFSNLPNIVYWRMAYDEQWTDIFVNNFTVVLPNVYDVILTLPKQINFRVETFRRNFPNLKQLQVTVNHPSIVNLIDAYKDQLEKLSMCSVTADLRTLFYDISFPKLSDLYLGFRYTPTDRMSITKCENFFKNPNHTRNLHELKLYLICASILPTICSNCTSLRVLEVCTTNIDFLRNITNLRNLEKLSIKSSDQPFNNQQFEHYPNVCDLIQTLKSVEIIGTFGPTTTLLTFFSSTAPNLEALSLGSIRTPSEEIMQIISETLPNIHHLKLDRIKKPPNQDFGYLQNMTNLVTYSLHYAMIDEDAIPKWIQMAPNLSKITLTDCETLTDAHLTTFGVCCPKLRQLELKDCVKITAQGLEEFKQSVPYIMVTCENKLKCARYVNDFPVYAL